MQKEKIITNILDEIKNSLNKNLTNDIFNCKVLPEFLTNIKVSEVMHKNEELPLCSCSSNLFEILEEMTNKKFGCAIIVDDDKKIYGIFTDGDIRRKLLSGNNILSIPMDNLINKNPKTIQYDISLLEAIKVMEEYKIQQIIIIDNNRKPVGIINFHDLFNLVLKGNI